MDLIELPGQPFPRHPWELARARFFCDVVLDGNLSVKRVLDVGSGDGFLARQLLRRLRGHSRVVCFDVNYSDAFLTNPPGPFDPQLTFTATRPEGTFDLLLLLDVAEHVPDDRSFLSDLVTRNLSHGGHLLISVPAHMALFTRHDLRLRHYRRYTPESLRSLVVASGLAPLRSGGLFHSLVLPRGAQKLAEIARGIRSRPDLDSALSGESDAASWTAGRVPTALMNGALRVDNAVSKAAARLGVNLPGLSTWMLAGKA